MNVMPFIKMHGLGNDFVVLDARRQPEIATLSAAAWRRIADRRRGVGCDQVIVLEPDAQADLFMRIRNSDGGEVEACGNATRCVAHLVMTETGRDSAHLRTVAGTLSATRDPSGTIAVDMGPARTDWHEIPLATPQDTLSLALSAGPLSQPVAVNMGNPHAVFFVDDVAAVDLDTLGPTLEHDPLFPQRANIEVVEVIDRTHLRMRVWERGVGITQACGTGACAALVAAVRRGLADRRAEVALDGGPLVITWAADGHVHMAGPTARSFSGTLDPSLLA